MWFIRGCRCFTDTWYLKHGEGVVEVTLWGIAEVTSNGEVADEEARPVSEMIVLLSTLLYSLDVFFFIFVKSVLLRSYIQRRRCVNE